MNPSDNELVKPVREHDVASASGRPRRGLTVPVALVAAPVLAQLLAGVAEAHGGLVPPEPTAIAFLLDWSFDPLVWLPAILALVTWRALAGRANRAHPESPVERRRTISFVLGVAAIVIALDSGIARYDTTLFSVHMVQHLVLTLLAPPLLLWAGPITLLLRAVSHETRRRVILPILHARLLRLLAFPVVSWTLFSAVMWATHFSPLFDLSLENPAVHMAEHALFLVAALLFWWPVTGPDPAPWRLPRAGKIAYAFLQMPQNTFLAVSIYMSSTPLYSHYVTTIRSWGPTPLEDQAIAGGIMWVGGDVVFLGAVGLLLVAWMRAEERGVVAEDRRLEPERAAIREREAKLAARRATESGQASGGTGAAR